MLSRIKKTLSESNTAFVIWAVVASFGAYFCMYAFRKPFSAGLYQGLEIGGVAYKAILIISQVAGYTLSKFMGIKIISELRARDRIKLIVSLIVVAEISLLLFGLAPYPYNFVFLFVNGLPLGMVYGIVFSFLEGRRFTEMIAMGLSISVVVSSGILKTIYLDLHAVLPAVTEFWMPALMGALFFPLFLLCVGMLAILPAPTEDDKQHRTERVPMSNRDKKNILIQYGFPIICLVMCYAILVVVRDFRDNFTIEIWNEIDANWSSGVLAKTEMIAGFVVFIVIGALAFVESNKWGFRLTNMILLGGMLLSGTATFLFQNEYISGFAWMLVIGVGFFLSYTAIQTVVFERMIARFQMKANAGFFVYICESIGYMGSAGLLLYKEFFIKELSWSQVLIHFTYIQALMGLVLLVLGNTYLEYFIGSEKRKWPKKSSTSFA